MKDRLSLFKIRVRKLINYIYCLIASKGNYIVLNSWIQQYMSGVIKRNYGDELSYYLIKELTGKHVVNYYDIPRLKKKENILFIGSLVEHFVTPDTVIWGSGALIGGSEPLRAIPKKVLAVRGKFTRDYLLNNGVDCPEVYGDPALLLPYVYKPNVNKKFKIGIIPHHSDIESDLISRIANQASGEVRIINFVDYHDWKTVIDEICECEYIISSSLHGLIIADAYNIPNLWIKLSDKLLGGEFKFLDYFSGVNRSTKQPFVITKDTTVDEIFNDLLEYSPVVFDYRQFIAVAPISLKLNI